MATRFAIVVQITALSAALIGFLGWSFLLGAYYSDTTLDALRVDPEFDSMVAIAYGLSCFAPVALMAGVVALWWHPRYLALTAVILGAAGTWCLVFIR